MLIQRAHDRVKAPLLPLPTMNRKLDKLLNSNVFIHCYQFNNNTSKTFPKCKLKTNTILVVLTKQNPLQNKRTQQKKKKKRFLLWHLKNKTNNRTLNGFWILKQLTRSLRGFIYLCIYLQCSPPILNTKRNYR